MNRLFLLLLALLAVPAFAQKSSEDEAGDVSEVDKDSSGPLRDRIRPVSGHQFLMAERFEISPGVDISVRDSFWQKVGFGASFTYHFNEDVALSLRGMYNLSLVSGVAQICRPQGDPEGAGCAYPTKEQLTTLAGKPANVAWGSMSLLTSLDLQWSPIYGKLSLFAEKFIAFNMYLAVGPSFLLYGPSNTPTVGGNVGIGFRFFINSWLTVRLEVRDVIYGEIGALPDRAGNRLSIRNQIMPELGFSMFIPTLFKEGR
jgi:outer membrane beta-barrel protein